MNIPFNASIAPFWTASLIIVCVVIVLHCPYHYECWRDRYNREYGILQSVLYYYEYGPNYECLDYGGLRRLQCIIFNVIKDAWSVQCGDMVRWLVFELRRQLGL